jgi:hypothetical protein
MKNNGQPLTIFVGLFLLGAMAVAGIGALEYIATMYISLDPQVARVAASCLVVLLIAALIIARSIQDNGAGTLRLRSKRTVAYEHFVNYWIDKYGQPPSTDNPGEAQALDRLIALYGSTEMIKAHLTLRTMKQGNGSQEADMRAQFGKAMITIRKDLGADTLGITAQQLLQLVLPQPDIELRSNGTQQPRFDSEPTTED